MKIGKFLLMCCAAFLTLFSAEAQLVSPTAGPAKALGRSSQRLAQTQELPFDPELKPFYHGVASGDPLQDAVIIWTRITPDVDGPVEGTWRMFTDAALQNLVQEGQFTTSAERDYTVKMDVQNLQPGTTYYFYFEALEATSLVGRTRTAPSNSDHLRFAVVSCQNYEGGYFNAYGRIAAREDLDAVIHLGDYIYEYGAGTYGVNDENRQNIPESEILTAADYRTRYSLYRLDKNLMEAHRQHPFIPVWDDHESANDAYKDGAQNHDEASEGAWVDRLAISKQVYAEWMPIRGNAESIYRSMDYGNLLELIMLDTRIEGREEQINDVTNPALYAPDRTLLGTTQRDWFLNELEASTARWKVVGNQIIFSEFNVAWAAAATGQTPEEAESLFLDIWDGYPAERDILIDFTAQNQLQNVVWLTGDFHSAFAFDVAKRPSLFGTGFDPSQLTYDPSSGAGSVAVEFATPSISSANFDENAGATIAAGLEMQINQPLPESAGQLQGVNPNPHMKFVDLDRHGYFVLDLTEEKVQADWYFMESILEENDNENLGASWFSNHEANRLTEASAAAAEKTSAPELAPEERPEVTGLENEVAPEAALFGFYPNPSSQVAYVNYAVQKAGPVSLEIVDLSGRVLQTKSLGEQATGNYTTVLSAEDLPKGTYLLRLRSASQVQTRRWVVE